MASDGWHPNRRTVIGTTATSVALALAGCAGDSANGDGTSGDTESQSDNGEPADADQQVAQLDSPTDFPDGEGCAVCNMVTPDHPEWNAQLVKERGTRVYFCSSGCMSAYTADPEHFGGDDEEIENVWVTDYETGELIDGQESHYVRVKDSNHVDDIMMKNPTPFAERSDAEAFINELNDEFAADYEHNSDIITFDEFDMELAMFYRGQFFGDGDDKHDDH